MEVDHSHKRFFGTISFLPIEVSSHILQVYPTLNKTLLLRTVINNQCRDQELLFQVSSSNQILWQLFISYSAEIDVIEQTYVVVADLFKSVVTIYSLQSKKSVEISRPFQKDSTAKIMVFPQNKLFCVAELSCHNKQAFITYYSYENIEEMGKLVHQKAIQKNLTDPEQEKEKYIYSYYSYSQANYKIFNCRQLNNESLVGWSVIKTNRKSAFFLYSFQKTENKIKERMEQYQISEYTEFSNFAIVRQISKNEYLMSTSFFVNIKYFVLETDQEHRKGNIRPLQLTYQNSPFNVDSSGLIASHLYSNSSLFVFKSYKGEKNVVFVDMRNKKVEYVGYLGKQERDRTLAGKRLIDDRIVIEYDPDPDPEQGKVVFKLTDVIRVWKEIYLHFLLCVNEDLDDDLLYDCIDLLVELQ